MKFDYNDLKQKELSKVGVIIIDKENYILKCSRCETEWSMMVNDEGRMPENYWVCPSMCN